MKAAVPFSRVRKAWNTYIFGGLFVSVTLGCTTALINVASPGGESSNPVALHPVGPTAQPIYVVPLAQNDPTSSRPENTPLTPLGTGTATNPTATSGNVTVSGGSNGSTAPPPTGFLFANPLPVVVRDQEGYFTCWSTCAEMIMEFVGGARVRQCEQAFTSPPGQSSICCAPDSSMPLGASISPGMPCDHTGLPSFSTWGFSFQRRVGVPLSWVELKDEIDNGRPFAFSLVNATGTISHMFVVVGYNEGNGVQAVLYLNPGFPVTSDVEAAPYTWYRGTGGSTHQYDYFMIR